MGIPSGNYPKMVTDSAGRVPLVYPSGHAKQFTFVIFNNATEEAAYTSNGVAITTIANPTSGSGNGWSSGQWSNTGKK